MTTIGYGDYAPATVGGRYLVGLPTMIFGIGFLGYIITQIADVLIASRSRRLKGMADITSKKHIVIINYTTEEEILVLVGGVRADVKTRDLDIVLVDERLAEAPDRLVREGVLFVKGNPTTEETLKRANMSSAGYAVIPRGTGRITIPTTRNLATVLVLEKLNPDIFTVVEVVEPSKVRVRHDRV